MRPEKVYLVKEAADYLTRSEYVFLTDYQGINVEETTELRNKLAERGAEFHVVKNSSLKLAAKENNLPDLSEHLTGHTAIVIGGDDASSVAKVLGVYFKDTNKVPVKAGRSAIASLVPMRSKHWRNYPDSKACGLSFSVCSVLPLLNWSAFSAPSTWLGNRTQGKSRQQLISNELLRTNPSEK